MKQNLKQLISLIEGNNKITLLTHIEADGDTVCSSRALRELIKLNYIDKQVKISGEPLPRYLNAFGDNDVVDDEFFNESLKIVIDTSTYSRIHDQRGNKENFVKIDHHPSEGKWLLDVHDTDAPACGQLIFQIAEYANWKTNDLFNEMIFVSIWTDTDGLSHRNVTTETTRIINCLMHVKDTALAKIKLNIEEEKIISNVSNNLICENKTCFVISETIVSNDIARQLMAHLIGLVDWEKYSILVSITKNTNGLFRGEIRSKNSKVECGIIAKQFGGGGHKSASGFRANSNIEAQNIIVEIKKIIDKIK